MREFSFDTPELTTEPEPTVTAPVEPALEPIAIEPELEIEFEPERVSIEPEPTLQTASPAQEIDISNEWEDMIEVEPAKPAAPTLEVQSFHEIEYEPTRQDIKATASAAKAPEVVAASKIAEKIQEIQFYVAQEMWEPAKAAILDLTELAPDAPEVTELIAQVSAGQAKSKLPTVDSAESTPVMIEDSPAASSPIEIVEEPVVSELIFNEPAFSEPTISEPTISEPPPPPPPRPVVEKKPPVAASAPAMELEDVLDIPEPPKAKPAKAGSPQPAASAKAQSTEDILSDFVLDLEQTELADFAPKQPEKVPAPPAAPPVASRVVMNRRANGDMQDAESANVLSDILSELRDETEEIAEPQEDPETHYNLGIAFKEMGLLDEAIGELQKVCHAVDRGAEFSQPIQAFTWLAQCLVDKGAPEAAVRWYQRALHLPGLDDGSRCAIYYDLATAFEAFGDKKSALANFMEVYGSNIDFRDVASRIKALKS